MKTATVTVVLVLGLLSACARTWVKVDGDDRNYRNDHYSVVLPAGWMRLESGDSLILSKDGILLQIISIQFRQHKDAFEKIGKDSAASMLPSELAQLVYSRVEGVAGRQPPQPGDTPEFTGYSRRSYRL